VAAGHSVEVDPARWQEVLDELLGRVAGRFGRVDLWQRARAFVRGLLLDLPRKNCWTIAEHAGRRDRGRSLAGRVGPDGLHIGALVIHQSRPDRSKDDQQERKSAGTYPLTWGFVARREGLEPPTAGSVGGCSASGWSAPVGSRLLRLGMSSVQLGPGRANWIVWMTIGMTTL
jgi:hypothetical protein